MTQHPWGASTPEINATVIETGSTGATWAAASEAWLGLADATMATMTITGAQMAASFTSISGVRSLVQQVATPPFLVWLGTMAGIAFKQAAVTATVAEAYGVTRSSMIPSAQAINNRVNEAAAEATNFFGQNTPLIAALNAEYAEFTMQNATLGTTYGEVITAATLPVPVPPPPPLSSAAEAAADAGSALGQAGQLVSQASGEGVSQSASEAASVVGQGSGDAANSAGLMGQMSSLMSAPLQALQGAGGSNPLSSLQQLLSAPTQMFGQAGGLGDLLGGGSTGNAFSPTLTGAGGGLPLGSAGLGAGGGASLGGGAGAGGLGGAGSMGALAARNETRTSVRTAPVLSGVTSPGLLNERVATTTTGGAMPVAPGAGASSVSSNRGRRDTVLSAFPAAEIPTPRREATGSERDLFN